MKNRIGSTLLITGLVFMVSGCGSIDEQISKGRYNMASKQIDRKILSGDITPLERVELENKKEIMRRIEIDFNKTLDEILPHIRQYYPEVTSRQIKEWEKSRALEKMNINGKDRYFARAAQNLFRIDPEARQQKIRVDGETKDNLELFLEQDIPRIMKEVKASGSVTGKPVKMEFTYTLTVPADAVPAGEILRCWLPFPREGNVRQTDIKLISANCDDFIIAPNSALQRTVYMQKPAVPGEPTVFQIEFLTTNKPQWFDLENTRILPYQKDTELYRHYTAERDPHLLFTPALKALSAEIVGEEKDPYLIVKSIFDYINDHYPWASAREYSTIDNIPDYVIEHKHGDCGQVTLLFMALARYNGIPARWQSGWMLHPGSKNLHDWCEIYFEGPGWVPVDQSFGPRKTDNKDINWFYLGGMDAYRLIVNDDYAMPLFPEKHYLRSETNDFQRGEVEWRGGNLYFGEWRYSLDIKYLNQ
jgi:hypothetical protein